MTLKIALSKDEESRLSDAAQGLGESPEEYARRLLVEHLCGSGRSEPLGTNGVSPVEGSQPTADAGNQGSGPGRFKRPWSGSRLPPTPPEVKERLYAHMFKLQNREGLDLKPGPSVQELFAQWREEDAQMTEQERKEADRIAFEVEQALLAE